jgi:redox-sensitive bicupin YhaK (pirin superfamily)
MIRIRRSAERGHFDHGWLDTRHTFSFGDYNDPRFMGFRSLRVLNEDRVSPGQGFGTHGHRDMEIVSYVLEGKLAHKDSTGGHEGSVIVPGDVQYMSAGTGVRHSEFNGSQTEPVHFVQIWIVPEAEGLPPRYDQKRFDESQKKNRLRLVASRSGADGSIAIRQDVNLYASVLAPGASVSLELAPGRHAWVQVLRGGVEAAGTQGTNRVALEAGDGLAASEERRLELTAASGSHGAELLVFDLA